jgi:hypothetical protein
LGGSVVGGRKSSHLCFAASTHDSNLFFAPTIHSKIVSKWAHSSGSRREEGTSPLVEEAETTGLSWPLPDFISFSLMGLTRTTTWRNECMSFCVVLLGWRQTERRRGAMAVGKLDEKLAICLGLSIKPGHFHCLDHTTLMVLFLNQPMN